MRKWKALSLALIMAVGCARHVGVRASNAFEQALTQVGDYCLPGRTPDLGAMEMVPSPARTAPAEPSWSTSDVFDAPPPAGAGLRAIRALQSLAELSDIHVARFRRDRGDLLVIGPPANGQEGLRYDDWLAAFRAIAHKGAPGVSIDPGPDPKLMSVRYFGGIDDTHVGVVFFHADRTLKLLSTGYDNATCAKLPGLPPGVRTELELLDAEMRGGRVPQQGWHRFWFEPTDEEVSVSADGLAMVLPAKRLVVLDEPMGDAAGAPFSARQFAQLISHEFPALTTRIRSFALLQRQAGLVRLAKWMVDKGIPADQAWLDSAPPPVPTPRTTAAVTVVRASVTDRQYIRIGIYGGVDFRKPNSYVADRGAAGTFVRSAERVEPAEQPSWQFEVDGRAYRAIRLPYDRPVPLRAASDLWAPPLPTNVPAPKPYLLAFPTLEDVGRDFARSPTACGALPTNVVMRGDPYVWDGTKGAVDEAFRLLDEGKRAGAKSGQLTVFLIHHRGQIQVGTYSISHQPAYREYLDVSVIYWPQRTCLGSRRLDGGEPPAMRPVQYVPGYGASVKLAEWIASLPPDK